MKAMGCLKRLVLSTLVLTVLFFSTLLLLWLWLGFEIIPNQIRDPRVLHDHSFDYVIVGAGTAGCVLANKLSENPNVTVLLVEAGDTFGAVSIIPLFSTAMQGTKYDWAFRTIPQKYSSHGLGNNQQLLPRGKGLGGSGQINYMLHYTGIPEDFDRWERLGANGWNWHAMKPYLDQLNPIVEHDMTVNGANVMQCNHELNGDELYESNHHYAGMLTEGDKHDSINFCSKQYIPKIRKTASMDWLHVTEVDSKESLLAKVFTESQLELGQEYIFTPARYNIRNGIRWSSYHAYLRPAFDRPNLSILTSTSVVKVLFDETKRTKAIVVKKIGLDHAPVNVSVGREVILCAGALQTPQLLKLSGIGPKLELQRHGIELVHDSPHVGKNYFDHLNLPLFVSINTTASVTVDKVLSVKTVMQYLNYGQGVLATTAIAGIGRQREGHHGVILFGMGSVDEQSLRHVSNMKQETFRAFFPSYQNASQEGFLFLSTCYQPQSRGTIYLRDRHIGSVPFINPNYLKDHADIECMTKAVRLAARAVRTQAFRKIGAHLHWPRIKRCSNFGPPDDEREEPSDRFIECILRTSALTGHHPGGTAAIGDNVGAVVDSKLRVNGVQGLRVVDASVFPAPVSGTPNSVVIAVAEKGSELILLQEIQQSAFE
uniref:Glucose-methanol-choline oxidoreductase N-terminal domain-containing protein n=1 Tax=Anopheles farauti TaxID=69004 RepID=A0A182QPL4_9DIPT